jgi:hypothetical protein
VNFEKYTTREEMIYTLESVVMYKGTQPASGHYTALRKGLGTFVLIDDKSDGNTKMDIFSFIHL